MPPASSHSMSGTPRRARKRPSGVTAASSSSTPKPNDWALRLAIAASAARSAFGNGDASAALATSAKRLARPDVRHTAAVLATARMALCVCGSTASSLLVSVPDWPMRPVTVTRAAC